jgi:enolase-phosphatase E1
MRTTPAQAILGVLTDIEGTTTSISFVYEVLFPYAEARLDATCARRAGEPAVAAALLRLRSEHAAEPPAAHPPPFGDGAAYARWLMAGDRKSTGLKALQGLIWEEGYAGGELRAHLFPDVAPALTAWQAAGVHLRVFSSGSRQAQQLLFAHTEAGDLTPLFEGFHDTTTGPKLERSSYRTIAVAFGLPAAALLFLSDTAGELDAAAAAGYRTALLERPGNRAQPAGAHPRCTSFTEVAALGGLALPGAIGLPGAPAPGSAAEPRGPAGHRQRRAAS